MLSLKRGGVLYEPTSPLTRPLTQGHEAQAQQGAQAHQGAQAQRITRSMARALGQEYNKMALLISFVE